jgi:bifunctional DNase/RNase
MELHNEARRGVGIVISTDMRQSACVVIACINGKPIFQNKSLMNH